MAYTHKSETSSEVIHEEDVEMNRVEVHAIHINIFKLSDLLKKFSDWNRRLNTINLLRRLMIKETEKYIIKSCQREHYTDVISLMEKKELVKNKHLSTLDVFLD